MKRKITAIALCAVMFATAIIGGTLAYFTDTEQATNTMVIGNVEINIEELAYDYDKKDYVDFEDDAFTLYPIDDVQGMKLFNKLPFTFNSSESKDDAYIRTIVLVEHNDKVAASDCCLNGIHFAFNGQNREMRGASIHSSVNKEHGVIEVDGVKYQVVVFTARDEKAIPYGDALDSFNSVWMDKNVTQEQAEGWADTITVEGKEVTENKVDIIVFSQAIQATGLTHEQAMKELGDINSKNLSEWIDVDAETAMINDFWKYKNN